MPRSTPLLIALLAGLIGTIPVAAAQTREPSQAERYMRMRAAGLAGDLDRMTGELNVLLTRDPSNEVIAQRAYRDAIVAGDKPLALKAARTLDQQKLLPPDGALLFFVDAVQAKDWKRARAEIDRVESDKLFAFIAPMLRAWVAVGAKDGDPLAALEPARAAGLGTAYFPSQHAVLLLAMGRLDEGVAEVSSVPTAGTRMRLAAAAALQRARRTDEAVALLPGTDPVMVAARGRIAAGARLEVAFDSAAAGVSDLLTQVAIDFNRQRLAPVGTMLARLATFADPRDSGGWIATANLLGTAKRTDAALAALTHVPADDPYATSAERLRIALLIDRGDKAGALAVAKAAAERPGAGTGEWQRVGDVYMAMDQSAAGAAAYEKAIAVAGPDTPADQMWPVWLQRGAALELAGDWPAAKAALARSYALAPAEPVVLNHLGYSMLSRREDVPQALKLIEGASKLRPEDPAITDSLGWARYLTGDAPGAVTLLERAVAGEPGEPTINEHLGDVYWALGRRIEARYAWRAALVTAADSDAGRIRSKIETAPTPATAAP